MRMKGRGKDGLPVKRDRGGVGGLMGGLKEKAIQKLPERSYQVDEPSWVVDKEQFQSIDLSDCIFVKPRLESSEILDALKDGELCKLIQKIDSSEEPENELTKAMEGRTFREFTDKILAVLNPQNQPAN
ncbi:hypothetical protein COCNU_04G003290 [Cocos nucifera]|uniref:Uncharacterized protein n=1 Tax=Cocos nucifera TaxID=13894 RepID=A0A8K0I602_COCNU|nr:hypothetical protein COCNU_04G003290 [Cocos nucifera]